MSTYLGNSSLSSAVKDRVISTFQQSIALYKQGRTGEVIAGCGLILQMDPQFDPAKKLLEKARNPLLPIDIDTLVPEVSAADALLEARGAMRARDFQRVINITTEILTEDLMNEDARILGDAARERMEAAPFIDQFARKFEQNLANNDLVSARATLEKASSLDADHPAIRQMESQLAGRERPAGDTFQPPSFVVDPPSPPSSPGRGTAHAADFGFSFEEQQPAASGSSGAPPSAATAPPSAAPPLPPTDFGGFSFDTPTAGGFSFDTPSTASAGPAPAPAEAKPPAANEFDFSSASFEMSPDDRKKIEQYLGDGDRAFEAADYQKAIDLWSRVFLIDVTNDQASERIEKAKTMRREIDEKADAILAAAIQAFDRRDFAPAREQFNDVLRLDPANSAAHDYLDRIALEDPAAAPAFSAPAPRAAAAAPTPPLATQKVDIFDDELSGSYGDVLTPPDEGLAALAAGEKKKVAAKPAAAGTKKALPLPLIAAVAGLVVLLGGGWFAYSRFFGKPALDPAQTKAIFTQAALLAQQGNFDAAVGVLQDVKPEDPEHDKAVLMIADLQHRKSQASEMIDGKRASFFYEAQIKEGQAAFDSHDFDGAKKAFEQATRVKPLPPAAKQLYDTAALQVAKLDNAKSLFRERRYQDAVANLSALQQQDPQNKNIQRLIIDAHFNLGATALQEERMPDAQREFEEVLRIDPSDELARRSRELAVRYTGQPKDLLFKIYMKYLPLRQSAGDK